MQRGVVRLVWTIVLCVITFVGGWFSALYVRAGEQAMGTLMSSVSAIAFLDKGDQANAIRTLQLSSEESIMTISRYGTPILDWYEPNAKQKWIERYAQIRNSHPAIEYPTDPSLRKRIDELLKRYTVTPR